MLKDPNKKLKSTKKNPDKKELNIKEATQVHKEEKKNKKEPPIS